MKNSITITSKMKMSSAIGNNNPTMIGEVTTDNKRTGLIYQMYYNQHSVKVEVDGVRDTEAKRYAIRQFVENNFSK